MSSSHHRPLRQDEIIAAWSLSKAPLPCRAQSVWGSSAKSPLLKAAVNRAFSLSMVSAVGIEPDRGAARRLGERQRSQ